MTRPQPPEYTNDQHDEAGYGNFEYGYTEESQYCVEADALEQAELDEFDPPQVANYQPNHQPPPPMAPQQQPVQQQPVQQQGRVGQPPQRPYYTNDAPPQTSDGYVENPSKYAGFNYGGGTAEADKAKREKAQKDIFTRRRVLQLLVATGAIGSSYALMKDNIGTAPFPSFSGGAITEFGDGEIFAEGTDPAGALLPGSVADRILVVVELAGGNDGLSTVIPASFGTYYDLRPNVSIPPEEVLPLDDQVGLHPSLTRLHARGIASVEGVGATDADLSHFAMVERWNRGDVTGESDMRSGFLARLIDTVNQGSPLTGLSVAGFTPRFTNAQAATMALNRAELSWYLNPENDNPNTRAFRKGVTGFAPTGDPLFDTTTKSWNELYDLAQSLRKPESEGEDTNSMFTDGGGLGRQLGAAAEIIGANVGVRVVHAKMGGYDTHENHLGRQATLLGEVDAAVDGFLVRMAEYGIADKVIVATTSEFGRRVPENNNGLDHGAASTMLIAGGPVQAGRYGAASPLNDLDGRENLKPTVSFDSYLASLAQDWLGIEAGSVLPGDPEVISFVNA